MPSASLPVIFATSFGVGFSGAVTPGPLFAPTIRESLRRGFLAGPLVVTGHSVLELLVVAGLALGVSPLFVEGPAITVISFLGGLFLIWMGSRMVFIPTTTPEASARSGPALARNGEVVMAGALMSVSNPYWSIWWATIGLNYVIWARDVGAPGVALFYVGHILSDAVWYGAVALAIAGGRRIIGPGLYRGLMVVCGLFLLAMGGYFFYSGVGFIGE